MWLRLVRAGVLARSPTNARTIISLGVSISHTSKEILQQKVNLRGFVPLFDLDASTFHPHFHTSTYYTSMYYPVELITVYMWLNGI